MIGWARGDAGIQGVGYGVGPGSKGPGRSRRNGKWILLGRGESSIGSRWRHLVLSVGHGRADCVVVGLIHWN